MLTARFRWAACWLGCLALIGATCSGGQVDRDLGYVQVGGKPAVYAPVCPGDTVSGVRVYRTPEGEGDSVLLWQASAPVDQATRDGLIVLGEGFETTQTAPPQQFPPLLSISVETAKGKLISEARQWPAEVETYPAGTPASQMTLETEHGKRSFDELRSKTPC